MDEYNPGVEGEGVEATGKLPTTWGKTKLAAGSGYER
jgi:hypothetical protein